jgi:hypothetical protein
MKKRLLKDTLSNTANYSVINKDPTFPLFLLDARLADPIEMQIA